MSLLVTKYILNSTELKSTQNIKLYHFGHAILSVPFCPIPSCPYTVSSIPFCPYHFVPYHFVRSPRGLVQLKTSHLKELTIMAMRIPAAPLGPQNRVPEPVPSLETYVGSEL